MNGTYDKHANAAYVYLTKAKIAQTKVMSGEINFDLDRDDKLVGIEFLDANSQLAEATLRSFTQI